MMKKLRKIFLYIIAGLVSALLLIQIPSINTRLTQFLVNMALPKGMTVEMSPLKGEFPFWIVADSVKVSDAQGIWLEIDKLDFSWIAADVFWGKINIERIGAEKVDIIRTPILKPEKASGSSFVPPIIVETYFINHLKISPWYSGSIKLHGDVSLKNANDLNASLYLETIDQLEHGDADLLELKISKDSEKIKVFAEAKDSLTRFRTVAPELVEKIKEGDYALNIDLEVDIDGENINGIVSGAINNFESLDAKFDKMVGSNLDFHVNIQKDESGKNIIGKGEFTSSNHIKLNWDLNYSLQEKEYNSDLALIIPKVNKLFTPSITGNLKTVVTASGKLDAFHELKWKVTNLVVSGQPLKEFIGNVSYRTQEGDVFMQLDFPRMKSTVKSNFDLREGILNFRDLSVKGTDHSITGDISLHFLDMGIETANLDIDIAELSPVADLLDFPLSGTVVGHYKQNLDQQIADFTAKNLSCQALFFEEVTTKLDFSDIKDFKISLVATQGNLNDNKIHSLDFLCESHKGKGKFSNHLVAPDTDWNASGIITVIDDKTLKIIVQKAVLIYEEKQYLSLAKPLSIEIFPEQLKIFTNQIHIGEGSAQFSDLIFGNEYTGKVLLKEIPISVFSPLMEDLDLRGIIKGNMVLAGNQQNPLVTGSVSLSDFGIIDSSRKTQKNIYSSIDFAFKDNQWMFKGKYSDSEESKLSFQTSIAPSHLIPDNSSHISTEVKGKIYLSILNSFIWWGDRIKGILNIDFTSKITPDKSSFRGHLALQDGAYENAEFGTVLRNISLKSTFSDSQIRITNLTAKDAHQGTLSGSGNIDFNGFQSFKPNLKLDFQDLLLVNNDIVAASGSGHLFAKPKTNQSFTVGGEVAAKYVDIFLESTVTTVKNINVTEVIKNAKHKKKRFMKKQKKASESVFDLKVHIPEKLYVQGRGIKSIWKGDLHVIGPINDPDVKGELVLKRGKVELIGKHMDIQRKSKIWFVNKDDEIVPAVDITLEKMVQDVEAMIQVTGLVTEPKIEFISNPPLSQEEVVSLILFGKPLNSVSSAQSLQLATALASIKAGNNQLNILDQFQQAFGLDELTFQSAAAEGEENGQSNASNYSVRVGKQLNDKVYFGVDQGLGEEGKTKAIIDIDITKNTKVDIEVGPQDTSVGYFWEKRY